jgi:hypothetical protein
MRFSMRAYKSGDDKSHGKSYDDGRKAGETFFITVDTIVGEIV